MKLWSRNNYKKISYKMSISKIILNIAAGSDEEALKILKFLKRKAVISGIDCNNDVIKTRRISYDKTSHKIIVELKRNDGLQYVKVELKRPYPDNINFVIELYDGDKFIKVLLAIIRKDDLISYINSAMC